MENLSDKEVYRLWWEFLKRSKDYKLYCELRRNPSNRQADSNPRKNDSEQEIPEKKLVSFEHIYTLFKDVHADPNNGQAWSFANWWKNQESILNKISENRTLKPVRDYRESVNRDMDECIKWFKARYGREPELSEFRTAFPDYLKSLLPPKIQMEVDITRDETGVLLKHFNRILLEEKDAPFLSYWRKLVKKENWPASKIRFLELKRSLIVYDLWNTGMKLQQIILKIGTAAHKKNYNDEQVQAVYKEDIRRARKIISNVEKGEFPGHYGKYS